MKWSKQLTKTTSIFETYTDKVKDWDQQLTTSAEEISKLNRDALEVESLQQRIDQQLMFVESQQDELDKILDNYEQQADALLNNIDLNSSDFSGFALVGSNGNGASAASGLNATDNLRDKAYRNAELLDERLDSLGLNLSTLVNEINSVSDTFNRSLVSNIVEEKGGDKEGANTVEEIVKLLNLHLSNLKYIETTKEELEQKLTQLKGPKRLH